MPAPRPSWIALLVVLVAFGLPDSGGLAHDVRSPRVVQLIFQPQRLTLGLGLTQHAGPQAAALQSRFDVSGDGRLDEQEQGELAVWLDSRGRRSLRLVLDGEELQPEVVERNLSLGDDSPGLRRGSARGEGDAFRLRSAAVLAIALRPGDHKIRISDTPDNPRQLVPMRLDLPPGWELSDVLAEGEALPFSPAGERSWQGAFAGRGGSLSFTIGVPSSVQEADSGEARGATESLPKVGSRPAGSHP